MSSKCKNLYASRIGRKLSFDSYKPRSPIIRVDKTRVIDIPLSLSDWTLEYFLFAFSLFFFFQKPLYLRQTLIPDSL